MDIIPLDIFKEIFLFCDFLTQIRFRQTCKILYNILHIIDFYTIEEKYLTELTDDIIKIHKSIKCLNAAHNPKIQNVSWMKNLKELTASGYNCVIDQIGIQGLDLTKLNAWNNQKIKDVSWMKINAGNLIYFIHLIAFYIYVSLPSFL